MRKVLAEISTTKRKQRLDKSCLFLFLFLFSNRLIHDRELTLYDGTRLLREDRYQNLKEELKIPDEKLQER